MIWVVPAWKGWQVLSDFYQAAAKWSFSSSDELDSKKYPLYHAAGLVFCHHNAPIYRIKKLASDLAEKLAKKRNRAASLFAYEVLESFDHIGRNVEVHRQGRVPVGVDPKALILDGTNMPQIAEGIAELKKMDFPTGRLHKIVTGLLSRDASRRATAKAEGDALANVDSPFSMPLHLLFDKAGGDQAAWIHIVNLWDYVGNNSEG